MTDNIKMPDFASDTAGELWAKVKNKHGDDINIHDIKGTGRDGGIKTGDIREYIAVMEAQKQPAQGAEEQPSTDTPDEPDTAPEEPEAEKEKEQENDAKDTADNKSGKFLKNPSKNVYFIEGVRIEPKGKVKYTADMKKSRAVKHAIKLGLLEV